LPTGNAWTFCGSLPDQGKNTKKLIGRGKIIDKKTTVANPEIHSIRCGRVSIANHNNIGASGGRAALLRRRVG
jgi:hypothetical protein